MSPATSTRNHRRSAMEIESEQLDPGVFRIVLSGRMDVAGTQQIDGRFADLTSPPGCAVMVDLSRVSFLASVGIRSLLMRARALRSSGGRMVLLSPEATVARVLELSGIDTSIGVFRDLHAARAALAGKPAGNA